MNNENMTIKESPPAGGNIAKRSFDFLIRSFMALFIKQKNVNNLFFAIAKKLNRLFEITSAVLIVRSTHDSSLKVIAIKKEHYSREGLALTLPDHDSLLYRVLRKASLHIERKPDDFSGNFIERKLLLDGNARTLAICPIVSNNSVSGLLCLSSPSPSAFDLVEKGILDSTLSQFGSLMSRTAGKLEL
jgi:transcriptional regulator with GAF, ATPase, and Fis domain